MEEKEKLEWTVENGEMEAEKQDKEQPQEQIDKIALADYVISVMPQEMVAQLKQGKTIQQVMAVMENEKLKKENEMLKSKLSQLETKPLELAGRGGAQEKDPFALGFIQAMNNY